MTVKELREKINSKGFTVFDLQEAVKFLAENIEKMTLDEELGFNEYIRRGAFILNIDLLYVKQTYQSYLFRNIYYKKAENMYHSAEVLQERLKKITTNPKNNKGNNK